MKKKFLKKINFKGSLSRLKFQDFKMQYLGSRRRLHNQTFSEKKSTTDVVLSALHDEKKNFWKKSILRVVCPDWSFETYFDDFLALEDAYASKIYL